jgi:hypothetical protein
MRCHANPDTGARAFGGGSGSPHVSHSICNEYDGFKRVPGRGKGAVTTTKAIRDSLAAYIEKPEEPDVPIASRQERRCWRSRAAARNDRRNQSAERRWQPGRACGLVPAPHRDRHVGHDACYLVDP